MSIGATVRSLFGPFEPQISDLYRAIYVDVADFVATIRHWSGQSENILEVGCGEGAVTRHLVDAFPRSEITGIDITPRTGRLFQGPRERVRFLETSVEAMAEAEPQSFDLVILSDVLHHVPPPQRVDFLQTIAGLVRPGGRFIFKDWARTRSLIYYACYASDRYLTGDEISYLSVAEGRELIERVFGASSVEDMRLIRPWKNNYAFLVKP